MNTKRNRDAFDDARRPDDDQVYVQEVPSGVNETSVGSGPIPLTVDDVAPKLDRTEARDLIGTAEVEPSGALMAAELDDPVAAGLIAEAEGEPSGAAMDAVDDLDAVDGFTICDETHL